jgi:signal transduction histidine kinase
MIKDDGNGCTNIHKSYGLLGIEERFQRLSGEVTFSSARNKGFMIQGMLPGRFSK